ncbi:MAG: hypothetical protein JXR12_05635 [Neptunomonas phycophila]|uniref:hypothetical protein n=1 Tax=Neptunomonas phycophila TaxID=1572645 RepID=UPI003B8D8424
MKDSKTKAENRTEKREQQKKDKEYTQLLKDVEDLKKLVRTLGRQNKAQDGQIRGLKTTVSNQNQQIQHLKQQLARR